MPRTRSCSVLWRAVWCPLTCPPQAGPPQAGPLWARCACSPVHGALRTVRHYVHVPSTVGLAWAEGEAKAAGQHCPAAKLPSAVWCARAPVVVHLGGRNRRPVRSWLAHCCTLHHTPPVPTFLCRSLSLLPLLPHSAAVCHPPCALCLLRPVTVAVCHPARAGRPLSLLPCVVRTATLHAHDHTPFA